MGKDITLVGKKTKAFFPIGILTVILVQNLLAIFLTFFRTAIVALIFSLVSIWLSKKRAGLIGFKVISFFQSVWLVEWLLPIVMLNYEDRKVGF